MKKWLLFLLAVFVVAALSLSLSAASAWGGNKGGKSRPPQPIPPARLGVQVAQLTPELAQKLGIGYQEGVVIVRVLPGSPAQEAGLLAKDIITAINGTPVKSPGDLKKALPDSSGEVTLTIVRQGEVKEIKVSLKEGFPPPKEEGFPPPKHPRYPFPPPWGWLPFLDELKDIPPAERFSHFLGGEFRITDKDSKPHTVKLVPGEVKAITEEAITIITNEGKEATFALGESARGAGLVSRLKPGTKVVVIAVDDGTARSVVPAAVPRGLPRPQGKGGR